MRPFLLCRNRHLVDGVSRIGVFRMEVVMPYRIPDVHRERIVRGQNNWWFLGSGGIARLYPNHFTAEGSLTPSAQNYLHENGLFAVQRPDVYALTVLTSTDCNLGCAYCFQNTGQDLTGANRPPRIAHARLKSETIGDILEFASRQMVKVGIENLNILLFGGEPLLNPTGCVELLARAADYGLASASMISNATLLTPTVAKKLSDLKLNSVQVTFDGDRPDHEVIRVRRSGGGTFDSIIDNMVAVSEVTPIRWSIRVNISHRNLSGTDALIERLSERLDTSRCSLGLAWVGDVGIGYENRMEHSAELAEQFFAWQRHADEVGFKIGLPGPKRPCASCSYDDGRYGATVNADGALSSCWDTAGKPDWQVGTVTDGYLPAEETSGLWVSCEDSRRYADGSRNVTAFNDLVDARFLDYLDEAGRL